MPKRLLMGNEAFAWAALEAGVNVVAGYPGTPSSELVEAVARLRSQGTAQDVHVEWSTNEKAALELLAGASMSGARCLFTCKQVGLNVASDPLLSLNYVGVRGGLVLFVCDDPGPISSQTEQDTRRFAAFAKVPVLDPATPEQGYAMMRHAFELSERYATPVIVRPTTRINHASTYFSVPERTQARPLPEDGFVKDDKWIIFPRRSFQAHGEVNGRLPRIAAEESAGAFNVRHDHVASGERATRGIVCGGVSTQYVREALAMIEAAGEVAPYRLLQVGTPYPFPEQAVRDFAEGLDDILVFEELDYVLEDELLKLAGRAHLPYVVHGKLDGSARDRGENTVEDCVERLRAFLFAEKPAAADADAAADASSSADAGTAEDSGSAAPSPDAVAPAPPVRPPTLCAGCPHRGAFYAVKRAVGKRRHVYCGDIGCYTLGNAKPLETTETCLCMGAGITMAQGFGTVDPDRVCIAFVGDSTFFASAMTGIANAVYNQHDICVCVLDNATTAMTGTQPHPGTGATLMGAQSEPIRIEAVLEALGVRCITHADPQFLEQSEAAAKEAIDYPGPSAVIFRSPCMQLVRPEPAATVDAEKCVGCRRCITSMGCPAMSMTTDGTKMVIDATACTGCGLCVDVCPFDAIDAPVRSEGRVPFAPTPSPEEAR